MFPIEKALWISVVTKFPQSYSFRQKSHGCVFRDMSFIYTQVPKSSNVYICSIISINIVTKRQCRLCIIRTAHIIIYHWQHHLCNAQDSIIYKYHPVVITYLSILWAIDSSGPNKHLRPSVRQSPATSKIRTWTSWAMCFRSITKAAVCIIKVRSKNLNMEYTWLRCWVHCNNWDRTNTMRKV